MPILLAMAVVNGLVQPLQALELLLLSLQYICFVLESSDVLALVHLHLRVAVEPVPEHASLVVFLFFARRLWLFIILHLVSNGSFKLNLFVWHFLTNNVIS